MTHKKYFSIIFTIVYILFSLAAAAHENSGKDYNETNHAMHTDKQEDAAKQVPVSSDDHAKAPHGKVHAPHSEELPHIHKFHKERIKKIRKHHGKCWFLSQVVLFLCHAAILYISYMHAAT